MDGYFSARHGALPRPLWSSAFTGFSVRGRGVGCISLLLFRITKANKDTVNIRTYGYCVHILYIILTHIFEPAKRHILFLYLFWTDKPWFHTKQDF